MPARQLSSPRSSAGALDGCRASRRAPRSPRGTRPRSARTPSATPCDAITSPPSDGPSTHAIWNMIVFRLIAFGRCSRGTRFGINDWRAGPSNDAAAEPSAVSR